MSISTDPVSKPYKPIDTDMVDNLEHYALDKIRVTIEFTDHAGETEQMRGLIEEVYTENHAEFLKMEGGRTLRLDQILSAVPHQHKA
jgi:transcriptional antiterminator Rof (Rho-off)